MGSDATRVFEGGGTIGRAPGNDWVLPDPERFVSGQHAVIAHEGGAYFLIDRSTNGTIVNGRELPKGGRVLLNSGDSLTIGNYEIAVVVSDARAQPAAIPGSWQAHPADDLVPGGGETLDPLDFFDSKDALVPRVEPASIPDHAPAESEFFAPPEVKAAPPPPPPRGPAGGAQIIPENWDETGFSVPSTPERPADPEPFAAPPPAAHADVRPAVPAPPPAERHRERQTEPVQASSGVRPAPSPAGITAGGIDGLFRAAGIDPADVDETALAALGQILHVVVEGLMEVLRARSDIKNQFRVAMTTLKPAENNPLKFSANADDALFNLFARRGNRSYKEPVEAFREAFADLKAHQFAMLAGMRSAFAALLARFDPDELQEGFDKGMKRAAILDVINKTKYWDLYREMHAELGNDDATFRRLFGDEFAQAYEEQMQRLAGARQRR